MEPNTTGKEAMKFHYYHSQLLHAKRMYGRYKHIHDDI